MGFKKIIGVVLLGMTLALGSAMADAKSRVSSKPSSYSSSSSTRAATVQKSTYSAPKAVTSTTNVRNVAPAPRTAAPSMYRSAPQKSVQKTTVIQKNYYGGSNGYNRGNSGYNSGGSYGGSHSGGAGLGTSIVGGAVGAAGGMLLMDALTEDEGEKALKLQQEQIKLEEARAQQERDDKQDQILENQEQLQDEGQTVIPEPSDSFFKVNPNLIPAQ
jgi:hypothetical protein